jgi:hypothetical protein
MPSFFSGLRKKLGSGEVKSAAGKTRCSEEYYRPTADLRENLLLFKEEIRRIKEQYEPFSFEYVFNVEFGEPLSQEDFYDSGKIKDYCQRNQVSQEKLKKFRGERLEIWEKAKIEITHRITLAKGMLLIRDNCCPDYLLERAITFEKIYGEPGRASEFKQMLANKQSKWSRAEAGVRRSILENVSKEITLEINPYGRERVVKGDWEKFITEFEKKSIERGLSFQDQGSGKELWEIWIGIKEKMNEERKSLSLYQRNMETEKRSIDVPEKVTKEEIVRS